MNHNFQRMISIHPYNHDQEISFRILCYDMDAYVFFRNHGGHYNDLLTLHRNGLDLSSKNRCQHDHNSD